ncbi:MAG: hypothetical protein WCI77_00825 [Candidatus Omnitrophota bacterium]
MNKKQLLFVCILGIAVIRLDAAGSAVISDASTMPKNFVFEKIKYKISQHINFGKNITIQHDLDGDGMVETIVGLQAVADQEGVQEQFPRSFLIMGSDTGDRLALHYIIPGNDYFEKLELKDMDGDGLSEIVFWQTGGDHYTSLDIYKYHKGNIKRIFHDGSSCSVRIEGYNYPYKIKVGREKWDEQEWCHAQGTERYEAYIWNGKKFVYRERLSTSKLVGEEAAASRYAKEMSERVNEPKGFIVVGQ